jgi:hypothetical protein
VIKKEKLGSWFILRLQDRPAFRRLGLLERLLVL